MIASPYDIEVAIAKARHGLDYCVHLTETCDDELPNLITNVETTPATVVDGSMTDVIHQHQRIKNDYLANTI